MSTCKPGVGVVYSVSTCKPGVGCKRVKAYSDLNANMENIASFNYFGVIVIRLQLFVNIKAIISCHMFKIF